MSAARLGSLPADFPKLRAQPERPRTGCGRLQGGLTGPGSGTHALKISGISRFPTITDPKLVGGLLRARDGYRGETVTAAALKLAPMTFVRPGELRGARWAEFDLDHPDGARWVIPPARRKLPKAEKENPSAEPHVVPLAEQAVAILRNLQPLTGQSMSSPVSAIPNAVCQKTP